MLGLLLFFRRRVPLLAVSIFVALYGLASVEPSRAQSPTVSSSSPDIRLTLGGTFQGRFSYGWITNAPVNQSRERIGFGMRRARLRLTADVRPRAGAHFQLAGGSGTVQLLDIYAFYRLNDRLRLRLGRFASAQPRAFQLTSHTGIDAVDRAAIAQLWSQQTLGSSGRDFGVDLQFEGAQGEMLLFLSNGDSSWDRLRGNYREAIVGDVTGGTNRDLAGLAASFYAAFQPESVPGLDIGGFIGVNGSENPNTAVDDRGRRYLSYAGHLYWGADPGSQPVRLKADVIGISFEELRGVPAQQTFGVSALGAIRLQRAAEVFGRFEVYDPNVHSDNDVRTAFVTAGASFSASARRGSDYRQQRLTLAYNARLSEDDDDPIHHRLVLQAQIVF